LPTSQILRECLELAKSASGVDLTLFEPIAEAVLDVIMDQLALGIDDGALDRMQLLRQVESRPTFREHGEDGGEMAMRPLETGNDRRVGSVLHGHILSWAIGYSRARTKRKRVA